MVTGMYGKFRVCFRLRSGVEECRLPILLISCWALSFCVGRTVALSTFVLSKSRHFQPTPVQTIDKTINTVNRCEE